MRTSSVTASERSEDGSEQAEQRKSIPKEIPEIAVDPSRALSHYLLWADKVKNVLLRMRPAEMWARVVVANLTGPAAAVARRAIYENMSGGSSLLTGIYGVGSWEGVVEQEWDDTKLGHREDLRALKERLDQLENKTGEEAVHEQGSCTSDPFKESGWWDLRTSDLTSSEVEKRKQKKEIRIVVKEKSKKEHVNKQR